MQRVQRVLERVTELPFSPVAAKILELARNDRIGAREIARIIGQDQAFTARLLKIANSPYYGQARAVTTVTQAVPVLGIDTISSLALALQSFSALDNDGGGCLSMRELWEHSMACGFFSREIAKTIGHAAAEESFIAGLLHDMGKALFYRFFKAEFLEAVQAAENSGLGMSAAEQSAFGIDHAAAGAVVARKWNLPELLAQTIEFHHTPLALPDDIDDSIQHTIAIVHVADVLSDHFQIGRGVESALEDIEDDVWNFLGLNVETCSHLLGTVLGEVNEFRKVFDFAKSKSGARRRGASQVARSGDNGMQRPVNAGTASAGEARAVVPHLQNVASILEAGKQLALLAGLDDLYPNIALQAMSLVAADAAHLFLPRDDGFVVAGAAGFPYLKGKRFPIERSLVAWVARMDEPLVLPNIAKADASWEKDFFPRAGFEAHLFLPVSWAGKRLAVLSAHARVPRMWNSHDIALLNAFGGFVAVALENARLYGETEEKAKALSGMNQKLQEALGVKSRFLATVSHELRSPLFVITGYANLIIEQMFGALTSGMSDAVEKIIKQANGLIAIITDLLEISQIDSGTFTVRHAPFDVKQLLDEAAANMPRLIGTKPITFDIKYDKSFYPIVTDRDRLKQVMTYLLDNAAKFTAEGNIVLSASVTASEFEMIVEDTGIGIDSEHQKIVFDGFRQLDQEDNRRYEGLGLGLYLSRRIVELLGGSLTLESKPGAGSRFCVRIPCGHVDGRPAEDPVDARLMAPPLHR